jgi:hypothetical protein
VISLRRLSRTGQISRHARISVGFSRGGICDIERDRGAHDPFDAFDIYQLTFAPLDGAAGIAFQLGVEDFLRILDLRALREGHPHPLLVGICDADDPVVVPGRRAHPLPLFDHLGIDLVDELAEGLEHLPAPAARFFDRPVDQPRCIAHDFFQV